MTDIIKVGGVLIDGMTPNELRESLAKSQDDIARLRRREVSFEISATEWREIAKQRWIEIADLKAEIERLIAALKTIMGEEGEGMMWSERCEMVRRAMEQKPNGNLDYLNETPP